MQAKASYALGRLGACGVFFLFAMSAAPACAVSAFTGNWVGPWQETTLKQSGSFLLVIDGNGAIEGVMTNGATHGLVRGEIADSGDLNAVYSYDGTTFYAAKGTFAREGSHLRGTAYYFTSTNQPIGSSNLDLKLATDKPDSASVKIVLPVGTPKSRASSAL